MSRINTTVLSGFGKRLMDLMKEKEIDNAKDLAKALLEQKLVTVKSQKKDIDKWKKQYNDVDCIYKKIYNHLNSPSPACLQGEFVIAYSTFFDCSTDYLFMKTDIKSSDPDVAAICQKTGLSEMAIKNLMSEDSEIYLGDYLYENNRIYYNPYGGEDPYIKTSYFWSEVLSGEMFQKMPEAWYRLAISAYFYHACNTMKTEMYSRENVVPGKQEFIDRFENYYNSPDCIETPPMNLSLEDIYDNHPDIAFEMIKDLNNKEYEEMSEDVKSRDVAYIGNSGIFDRLVGNYFHNAADNYHIPTEEEMSEDEDGTIYVEPSK